MFITAFLRIGEITACSRSASYLRLSQVTRLLYGKGSTVGFRLQNGAHHDFAMPKGQW